MKLEKLDNREIPDTIREIRAFLCVRNELKRLKWLISYYRDLGVNRFFIIDNGSTDGTTAFVLEQPDMHCFYTRESYSENNLGLDWTHHLLDKYGHGSWCLIVDADEQFIYPGFENIKLPQLCEYLYIHGKNCLFTTMLDMYSDKPLKDTKYTAGEPFLDYCKYFDPEPYNYLRLQVFPYIQIYGGVRLRTFYKEISNILPPTLSKVPLIRWERGMKYIISTHTMYNYRKLFLSEIKGVILHFKFFSDFYAYVLVEAAREEHFNQAIEYKNYLKYTRENPEIIFKNENSVSFENSEQLVKMGLMTKTEKFDRYCKNLF